MADVEEEVVGAGGEDHVGDGFPREADVDGGTQCALGGLRGTHLDEAAEPFQVTLRALLGRVERVEVEVRRVAGGGAGDVDEAVVEGERAVLVIEAGEDVGHGGEDGEAGAPARGSIADAEERSTPHDVRGRVQLAEADHALSEDEADVLLQALIELSRPVCAAILLDGPRVEPDATVAHLDAERGDIVSEGIEGATAGEVELGVMPVAGEDPVFDGAPVEREAHVRTTIVDGVDLALIQQYEHSAAFDRDDLVAVALQLLERTDVDFGLGFGGHGDAPQFLPARRSAAWRAAAR